MDISVIIPAYNEEENIPVLYDRLNTALEKLNLDYEIIIVDDGSDDNTFEECQKVHEKDRRFTSLRFEENCGQTAGFLAGFEAARGKLIITMDADLQNDPEDIALIVEKLKRNDAVCGWREKRQDNPVRILSSQIANYVRNKLSSENIKDTGCSLKGFHRECLKNLPRFEGMHRFFPTLIKMKGYNVVEVKVKHSPRKYGKSKYGISNRLFKSFADLLAVRWMKKRFISYKIKETLP